MIDSVKTEQFCKLYDSIWIEDIFAHDNNLFLYRKKSDSGQIVQIDPFTREVIREFPKFYHLDLFSCHSIYFTSDGENIWVAMSKDTVDHFDNRMAKYDLEESKIIQPEYRIPVYHMWGLKWLDSNFWTINDFENKIVKFQFGEIK